MLREYRRRAEGFPDLLNFAALVAEGVLLGKDGSFTAGWWYAGPDLEAASSEELAVLSSQVNAALLRLGNGWMLEANAVRRHAGARRPGASRGMVRRRRGERSARGGGGAPELRAPRGRARGRALRSPLALADGLGRAPLLPPPLRHRHLAAHRGADSHVSRRDPREPGSRRRLPAAGRAPARPADRGCRLPRRELSRDPRLPEPASGRLPLVEPL